MIAARSQRASAMSLNTKTETDGRLGGDMIRRFVPDRRARLRIVAKGRPVDNRLVREGPRRPRRRIAQAKDAAETSRKQFGRSRHHQQIGHLLTSPKLTSPKHIT